MRNPRRYAFGGLAVAVIMLSAIGCRPRDDHAHTAAPAGWPNQLAEFTIVWGANPGIDLTAGAAVPIRAYLESFELASATGDERYLYPGFKQATDENPDVRPRLEAHAGTPWVGSERNRIISVNRAGGEVRALVCSYTYGSAQREQSGGFTAQAGNPFEPNAGIYAVRVTLAGPTSTEKSLLAQVGPARTPHDDVFGGWRVAAHVGGYFTTTGGAKSDMDTCVATAPDPPERRGFLVNPMPDGKLYHPRSDFPTLAAYPGWPALKE